MKKSLLKYLISLFLISFTMVPLFADNAVVTFVKGKVEVLKNEEWCSVKVGDILPENSVISTGFQSSAKIQYKGTVMAMGPVTRLTIEKLADSQKQETVSVYLNTGAVRSKVTHPENKRVSQTVRNPVSVASVRGTDYISFDNGAVQCMSGAVVTYPAKLYQDSFIVDTSTEDSGNGSGQEDNGSDNSSGEGDGAALPDNGKAKPTTNAKKIADSPLGAVVVGGGQSVKTSDNGIVQRPIDNKIGQQNDYINSNAPVSQKESVNTASSGSSSDTSDDEIFSNGNTDNPVVPNDNPGSDKGSLEIIVKFE